MKKLLLAASIALGTVLTPFAAREALSHNDCFGKGVTRICKPHFHGRPSLGGRDTSDDANLGDWIVTPPSNYDDSVMLKVYNYTSHNIWIKTAGDWKKIVPGDWTYRTVWMNSWGNLENSLQIENKSGSKTGSLNSISSEYRYNKVPLYIVPHQSSSRHLSPTFFRDVAQRMRTDKSSSSNLNLNSGDRTYTVDIVNKRSSKSYYKIGKNGTVQSLSPDYKRSHSFRISRDGNGYKSQRIYIKQGDGSWKYCTVTNAKKYKKVSIKYYRKTGNRGCNWYSSR